MITGCQQVVAWYCFLSVSPSAPSSRSGVFPLPLLLSVAATRFASKLSRWLLLTVKQLCSLATNTSCQSTDHRLCISSYNLVSEVTVKLHVCKNQGSIRTSWILVDLPAVAEYCPAFSKTADFECQSFIWIGNPPTNTMFGTCVCLCVYVCNMYYGDGNTNLFLPLNMNLNMNMKNCSCKEQH